MTPIKTLPVLLLVAMTGCVSMAPKVRLPAPPVPGAWPEGPAYKAPAASPALTAQEVAWQDFYADAKLKKVLQLALENNRDLRIAVLNTDKVRAYYQIQRAELLPTVNAAGAGTRQRLPASVSGTGQRLVAEQDTVNVGISSWELDFFGRVRSLKNRALEQYLATEQARNNAQISLLGEVANLYLAFGADRENLKLAQDTLGSQEASYKLIQRRFEVGASSEMDARRAQIGVETARGDVARYTHTVALDRNALNLLVGTFVPPELLPETLGSAMALKDITPGLPSEVLTRRPDIRMAENQLRAANANIGAARAAFFPRIALTTSLGTMASDLSGLFKTGSDSWAFSPQITLPIFDTGSRLANLRAAKADRDIAVAQYEKAIQGAFREVADALAQRGTIDDQLAAQETLVQATETTHRLATARYTAGVDGYLSVLDAQRSLYGAQQGLIALRRAKLGNLVTLYKVLGGGHSDQTPAASSNPAKGQPSVQRGR
ncbi:MAG: AdeC/AdeK/OprM family multidrug efflux complex outer membrane factor [Acidobacteria bacterium]|nr:AdeC/AdeK/OprM family multidrug efflux complex outer membrane factor [Acidobacteriota bacterium]MBI3489671.1 AdeC/AdeK/OprM family multidrug efflux complex outer membrane factor [Acidobacteriota bacterium]